MIKKMIQRALLGFPLGVFIGFTITIIISAALADGAYHPVASALAQQSGSELEAVVFQYVLEGVMGASFAGASVLFEISRWSIFKRYMVYLVILMAASLPIAYFSYWMQHTVMGVLFYCASIFGSFLVIWFVQYFVWWRKIKKVNQKINDINK